MIPIPRPVALVVMSPVNSDNSLLILTVNDGSENSGNVSPLIPSPRSEVRGIRLFRVISRKLARRSTEDFQSGEESRSSSSDSSCSTSVGHLSRIEKDRSVSPNHISSSSSESGSDVQTLRSRHHHSTSAESLRKAFHNLNLYNRSQSCSNTKELKKKKEKRPQKSILRTPTSYTYVKGLSGLPSQRIARYQQQGYNSCSCSMHYLSGTRR
ncbi:uncharacterized protein LOC143203505 [Rhynchophorus ferrugineus]|uniref:DUF4797 domain-containing protein n=1 Tax=Rhynchophorus ferrugineus TaxID=354439 RepID=A0A834ITR5_RHYFE|nr:hypothetical protein GWI33_023014 [Rhynchophorus ferrugineus]